MFGYPIGAHDGLPSDVGISGPMEARILGAGVVPFRRVGRVRTAPLQGDLRSTGTRRTLQCVWFYAIWAALARQYFLLLPGSE
jgi:hypothetical protein